MTPRLILELMRIHLGRHDIPCDTEALRELLDVQEARPAFAVIGSSPWPRLTAEGAGMVAQLGETWETLAT